MYQKLKLKPDTIKLLEENIWKILNIGLSSEFLSAIPKAQTMKGKNIHIQIQIPNSKIFCTAKETIKTKNRTEDNICKPHICV